MQKELTLAIILGSTLGLLMAFGIWQINSKATPKDNISDSNITSPAPHNKPIEINEINNKNFATNNEILNFSSTSEPNNFVISISSNFTYITKANSEGKYEINHELTAGANKVSIITFNTVKNTFLQDIYTIVYSTEVDQNNTDLYFGSITDLSENTIQIRKDNGDIIQSKFSNETSFASIITKSKEIESDDLAIGDYIYSIGKIDEKNILNAKRILVGSFINDVTYEVKLTKISDESIDFEKVEDVFLYSENKIENIKLKDIDEEKDVIIVGVKNNDKIIANTIINF